MQKAILWFKICAMNAVCCVVVSNIISILKLLFLCCKLVMILSVLLGMFLPMHIINIMPLSLSGGDNLLSH